MNANSHEKALRAQVVALLDGGQAHVRLEDVIAGWSEELRGVKPEGASHSPWQVLDHIRIAQWDILEFSRNPHHHSPKWPDGYWPESAEPKTAAQWNRTAAQIRLDLDAMKALVEDPESDLFTPFGWGDGQTLLRQALLVADHNAYHLGEIMTLRRLLAA